MRRKFGNRFEYQHPIDLLDRPSNMEIVLYWFQIKNGSMWTYDMTDHVMVELDIIIALATMNSIIETNLYELHPMDERVFNHFINDM